MATVTSSKRHLLVTSDTYTSNGNVVVGGDLTVSGSTTTLDTQNLIVEDKNIIIGQVATPTDTTADGGGITLKGASDYTIAWNDSRNAWLFNQHLQPSSDFSNDLGGVSYRWNAIYGGAGVFANSLTIGGNTAVTRTGVGNTNWIPVFSSNDNLVQSRISQSTTGTYVHDSNSTTPLSIMGAASGITFVKFIGTSTSNDSYIEISPGTEAIPAINFGRRQNVNPNDKNTGIYSSAGDHVDIATGGSRRIGWDSAGTTLYTLSASTTDTDRFLVSDSGLIKYRTGSQIRSDIGAQPVGNYETDDGTEDRYIFRVDLSNLAGVTRWYKVATVNQGNGGLLMRGSLTNHVESFGSTKFDLTIQGRENNASDEIEITGSIDVFAYNTGVYIVKSAVSGSYTTYDVYIECYNYTQAWVELIKTGATTFDTSGNYVTTAPSGLVELDTSAYSEGSYKIIDSENRFSIRKITSNITQISGNAPSSPVLRIGANNQNQIYMDGSTVYINDDMETERIYINTCDTNTTSTTALVLNGTEVEKRTLGSRAFDSTSYLPLAGGTMSGSITMSGNSISMGNGSITNVNTVTINDPGYQEGITWNAGNGWGIWESPDNMANSAGSLQFSTTTTRQMTLDTSGVLETKSAQIVNNTTGSCVAHWSTSGSSTGAIKVTIPGTHSSNWSMLILRVAVYEYNGNEHTIFYVSGHDWTSGWYNNGVTKWGDSDKEISVAYDSNDDYIIIGDVASTWSYGHVTVDVVAHPSFYHSAMDITSGWAISQVTSLSGITVQSVTNKLVADRAWVNSQGFLTSITGQTDPKYLRSDANDTGTGIITLSQNNSTTPYPLIVKNVSNANGVGIEFDDNLNGSQRGYISHFHSDTKSYGSGAAMIISSSEPTTTILADGKLMYKEGIYSKPSSGTGAGSRKDNLWDEAYNNHITGIAVTGTGTKTITLTQKDGGTISANFTDQSGSAATEFSYTIDMSNTTTYAENTYYPVTIPLSQAKLYKFKIENALNTNVPGWSTHSSGFSLLLEYTTHGNGWGTHYQNRYISVWSERYANVTILGGITQMTNSSNEVLWLRGGGRYNLKSNVSGLTVTPRSSTYTASSQSVSPQTSIVNNVYSSADGIFAVDSLKAISQFVTGSSFLTTLNVSGNSYLGDGNGDQTIINDTLYVGASDSGDSHFYFGENSSNWYGEHWYWDSGYETERYSRHAGTDSLIEKHDTRYTHKIQTNRGYERLGHSTGYQIGSYNSVGGNSAKTNPIYVIGDSYRPTDTSISGMYGVGYAHDNLWGTGKSNGWGFYVAENGSFTQTLTNNGLWSAGTITSANQGTLYGTSNIPNFLRADTQDAYTPKRIDFGASSGWDAVGFGNITNLHVQGHNQFWFGAGNGTWFAGTANTKNSASGLAADATNAHDLLITTMQATAATDRGITFAVDSGGAGTSGYRLGKWHSSNEQHSSKLTIDGGLHVRGGDTANYDYYADDYSTYWDNQAGGAYWTGDTGWIDPSITAGNAIQIQAGNVTTNANNPALQFHQYGYGGVQFRYDGPSDVMHLESTGSNRYDYFQNKTDHGYIQIGPMNTSHAHIYTDRSNFYFNKEIRVLGGCTVKQTEFSLGSGHKVIWNNGYGNPYIQDYYGSININAPLYLGASGTASQNLYAAGVYVNGNAVWHAGSTGLEGTNRISTLSNANNSVPSGFYQASSGTNYPTTGTWYNLLNVRHSNTGNDHGFQIAASYYNEDIWTRTYSGGSGANNGTYTTWRRLYHEGHKPTLSELGAAASSHTHTPSQVGLGNLSSSGNSLSGGLSASGDISTTGGHFYGRSVNGTYSNLYRMGGVYFTWDSDSYGTNFNHSITSSYGGTYGDDLTINSYHHLRINIDSNNNNSDERFEIGQNTTGTGNVRFQVTGSGAVYAANDVIAYYSFSDKRLKTNIKPTTNNLEKVLKLEPVEYTWKDGKRDGKKEIGLVAQDVEKIVPEVVRENRRLSDDDDTLYKQVDYEHLVSTLIGAVQEQQDQIELLKAEIKELKNK